jgi:hypothetical protein
MLPIVVTIGSISTLPAPAFADTVKCKNNEDNNCNNTTIVQKITINNNCNIINENKDHSDHNQNVNQLSCSNQYANIYGSLINAPIFNTIFDNGNIMEDPFAPITYIDQTYYFPVISYQQANSNSIFNVTYYFLNKSITVLSGLGNSPSYQLFTLRILVVRRIIAKVAIMKGFQSDLIEHSTYVLYMASKN